MKKQMDLKMFRAAAVLLCAGGLMVSAAMAQQQDAAPPPPDGQMQGPPPGGHERRGMNPEHRMAMLQKRLGLSDDQTAQMKSIYEGQRAKAEAVRSNTALAPQDRRAQMTAIHEDGEAKIHAILTPDQKTKYDEMEARMRERGQERRRGGPDGAPPAPDAPAPPAPAPQP